MVTRAQIARLATRIDAIASSAAFSPEIITIGYGPNAWCGTHAELIGEMNAVAAVGNAPLLAELQRRMDEHNRTRETRINL